MTTINKHLFSHFPIDYNGTIWGKLSKLEFTRRTELPKDILCFLEEGIIRKFFLDKNSHELPVELSLDFYFAGDIFTAKAHNDLEKKFIYKPINNGVLWYVSMDEVRQMFYESQLCGATQKVFIEEQLREKTLREIRLLKSSPSQLYEYLLKNKPKFVKYIPLKYLASYIGITPQALSRIRKRIN